MIGIKTELLLGTEGKAKREVSTGRDKVRLVNSEGAIRHLLVTFSGNQLLIHLLMKVFTHPILPHNPACPTSSSLYCSYFHLVAFPTFYLSLGLVTGSSSHLHIKWSSTHISIISIITYLSHQFIHPPTNWAAEFMSLCIAHEEPTCAKPDYRSFQIL